MSRFSRIRSGAVSRGQSFMEMLVAVTVIALLSSLVILYTRTSEFQSKLTRNADRLAINLRKAQNLALLSREFNGQIPCGYGVHFDNNATEYIIFADIPSGPDCGSANGRRNPGNPGPEDVEIIRLDTGLATVLSGSPAVSDVLFLPPEPRTVFFPPAVIGAAEISVSVVGQPALFRRVRVTQAGQISVVP